MFISLPPQKTKKIATTKITTFTETSRIMLENTWAPCLVTLTHEIKHHNRHMPIPIHSYQEVAIFASHTTLLLPLLPRLLLFFLLCLLFSCWGSVLKPTPWAYICIPQSTLALKPTQLQCMHMFSAPQRAGPCLGGIRPLKVLRKGILVSTV